MTPENDKSRNLYISFTALLIAIWLLVWFLTGEISPKNWSWTDRLIAIALFAINGWIEKISRRGK
jgi:predicted ferric reductase